jgi:hypothetical protein
MKINISNYKKLGSVSNKFKIADKENDIRGWVVVGANGSKIGYIDELIVDIDKKKVVFIDVMLNVSFTRLAGKHILVPIEISNIHTKKKIVSINNLNGNLIEAYPSYEGQIEKEHENKVRDFLAGNISAEDMLTDQLSPGRLEDVSNEIKLECDSEIIMKLRKERDIALAERDLLLDENQKLRKRLEGLDSRKNEHEEEQYKPGFTDCDDIDTGRKC